MNYIGPYDNRLTYNSILRQQGFATVNRDSWHFGPDAHCFWANYMLTYLDRYNLLDTHALSLD